VALRARAHDWGNGGIRASYFTRSLREILRRLDADHTSKDGKGPEVSPSAENTVLKNENDVPATSSENVAETVEVGANHEQLKAAEEEHTEREAEESQHGQEPESPNSDHGDVTLNPDLANRIKAVVEEGGVVQCR